MANSGGNASAGFNFTLSAGAAPITISMVTVGAFSGGDLPLTLTTVETPDGTSTAYWVLVPQGAAAPSATEVRNGQASGGGAPLDANSFTWTASPPDQAIVAGIDQFCDIYVVIDNGVLSNVGSDTNFEVDSTDPILSLPTASETSATTATWGVTSNEADGTIYAGVRPAASAALTEAQLIAGSGGAGVAFDNDATPTADALNGGTFSGLVAETDYRVDIVQVDEFGGASGVQTSATFTTDTATTPSLNFTFIQAADTGETVGSTFTAAAIPSGTPSANRHIFLGFAGVTVSETTQPELKVTLTPNVGSPVEATLVPNSAAYGPTRRATWICTANLPEGTSFNLSVNSHVPGDELTPSNLFHLTYAAGWSNETPTINDVATDGIANGTALNFDVNTVPGYVFGAISSRDDAGFVLTGATGETRVEIANTSGRLEEGIFFSESITTGETPRNMGAVWTNADEYAASVIAFS